jgi:hypothetical protein
MSREAIMAAHERERQVVQLFIRVFWVVEHGLHGQRPLMNR